MVRRAATVLALVLTGGAASAQGTGGTLEGKLTDEQGLPLAGVTATARDVSTGVTRTIRSDATGRYCLVGLASGRHDLRLEGPGLATVVSKGLPVSVAATTVMDFRMALAARAEEVTVTEAAPVARVNSPRVSRRHSRIVVSDGRATIEDLGSKNGTAVGGRRSQGVVALEDGDEISIGPVVLTFLGGGVLGSTATGG